MMVKIIVMCLVLVAAGYEHHLVLRQGDGGINLESVECTNEHAQERDSVMENSKCKPKEVLLYLKPNSAHERVTPLAVWVKKCTGLCDFVNGGTCTSAGTTTRQIPVRIYNDETRKDSCANYPVEEDVSCTCCDHEETEECVATRMFIPPEPEYEVESI